MPELPDLQVFSKNLNNKIAGKKVTAIEVLPKAKLNVSKSELEKSLKGQTVTNIIRVGKELHFRFSNGNVLGMHMMLHGELKLFEKENDNKHTVLVLVFSDETGLALTDFQKAARCTLNPEEPGAPDALEITAAYLKQQLADKKSPIKKVLLDQDVILGIGNAYADEILWHARVSPLSVSNKIPEEQVKKIVSSMKTVLRNAEKQILKTHPDIISGEVRDFLLIHNPHKTHSPEGEKIELTTINSRKTYYTSEQELFK